MNRKEELKDTIIIPDEQSNTIDLQYPLDYTQFICDTIRSYRRQYFVQSKELAEYLGINNSNYSRLERGQVSSVSSEIIKRIISFYHTDAYTFNKNVCDYANIAIRRSDIHNHPYSYLNQRNRRNIKIFTSSSTSPLMGFRFPLVSDDQGKQFINTDKYLNEAQSLFMEIPLFSECKVFNSRIVFNGFLGKTYITHKLYLNNIYNGLYIVGLIKDDMISLVPIGHFTNKIVPYTQNELNKKIEDEYRSSLIVDMPYYIRYKNPSTSVDTVKIYNSYNFKSLSETSARIFLSFFEELVNLLMKECSSGLITHHNAFINNHDPDLYTKQSIANNFSLANDHFIEQSLEKNLLDCNDLLESVLFDSQNFYFKMIFNKLLEKYNC